MTRNRYMHADSLRELGEAQPLSFAESPDPPMNRASQTLSIGTHSAVLDQRSTSGKRFSSTQLLPGARRFGPMGFARHKRSPPKYEYRKVTPLFIKQVQAALKANDVFNTQHHLKKGEPGYRPSSHQDLADELGVDPNAIKNLMGGVRSGTKAKQPERSKLVDPICELLDIEPIVDVGVPKGSLSLVERIAAMSPEARAELEAEIDKKK